MTTGNGFLKRLTPLAATQFFGVFNDHAFKTTAVLAAIGASSDYGDDAAFLALITIVFVLPFITLSNPAGFLADRFPKRTVIIAAKFVELLVMCLGALALFEVSAWGVAPLIVIMFLMASQSAFFSPAFNGILPELFPERELSKANGNIQFFTLLAVIGGVTAGFVFKQLAGDHLWLCGSLYSILSFIGFMAALNVIRGNPGDKTLNWTWDYFQKTINGLKTLKRNRPVFLAACGDAFFMAIGTAVQAILLTYGKYVLRLESEMELGVLQLTLAAGIGLGCFLAGRWSRAKVEVGLVPIGAAMISIFLILIAWFPGPGYSIERFDFVIHPFCLVFLLLLGVGGGLFVLPLRATQQHRANPGDRGVVLAASNVICFSAVLVAGLLMLGFSAGGGSSDGWFSGVQKLCLSLDPSMLFTAIAAINLAVTFYVFLLVPVYCLRFIIVLLTNIVYDLRIKGAENIPEDGPALLVANHVSYVDGFLIMACTSRLVRFVMHEDFYRNPLLHPLVRWANYIEVPAAAKSKRMRTLFDTTREALRRGEIVCVFPEGKITRNGLMSHFKKGVTHMMPDDVDVPIIPIRLGMIWGSVFSYFHGKITWRLPKQLPYPAAITIGNPVPKETTPFQMRQIISEMAAATEMAPRDGERPLHTRFAGIAKRHPSRCAVRGIGGDSLRNITLLTGGLLLSRLIRRFLDERGDHGDHVGIMLPNVPPAAVAVLGTMMADRVPAMINYTASDEAIDDAVKLAKLKTILTSRKFLTKLGKPVRPEMVFLEDFRKEIPGWKRILAMAAAILVPTRELMNLVSPESRGDVQRTAVVLFSSGSTGTPKGVMLSHRNLNANVHSFLRVIAKRDDDKIVGNLPLFHSFGFNVCFWVPLMTGIEVTYIPNPLDAKAVGDAIEKRKLTMLMAAPTFLQAYTRKCRAEQFASLRLVITGAEKLRPDIAEKFTAKTGLPVIEGYGCTELSPVVCFNLSNSVLDVGAKIGKPGSVGVPMPGVCVKIVDPETREELPENTEGLMLVKGPNVMKGYLDDPKSTTDVIIDGWYDTGDVAKMDIDGYLTITGRLGRFSKIGGEMVPHELIEFRIQEILGSDEREVAVCAAPDPARGEKLLVLHTKMGKSPQDLIRELREQDLPNLWIPREKDFRHVDEIPLLGSGKLDLAAVKRLASATS